MVWTPLAARRRRLVLPVLWRSNRTEAEQQVMAEVMGEALGERGYS